MMTTTSEPRTSDLEGLDLSAATCKVEIYDSMDPDFDIETTGGQSDGGNGASSGHNPPTP